MGFLLFFLSLDAVMRWKFILLCFFGELPFVSLSCVLMSMNSWLCSKGGIKGKICEMKVKLKRTKHKKNDKCKNLT